MRDVFTSCNDVLRKKQFCYMLARHVSPGFCLLLCEIILAHVSFCEVAVIRKSFNSDIIQPNLFCRS